jgi:adenine-specific DNA-methyltransferase
VDAFARMFERFEKSVLVLSYSSNGYPDLEELVRLMKRVKRRVSVLERPAPLSLRNPRRRAAQLR